MFINVGALFSPIAAVGMRNWWLEHNGFQYNSSLPELCHSYLKGTITPEASGKLSQLASEVSMGAQVTDLTSFANNYLNVFATGFHYAFGIAIIAMLISVTIYVVNKNIFPDPSMKAKKTDAGGKESTWMLKKSNKGFMLCLQYLEL